jgi:hypothetical protein
MSSSEPVHESPLHEIFEKTTESIEGAAVDHSTCTLACINHYVRHALLVLLMNRMYYASRMAAKDCVSRVVLHGS